MENAVITYLKPEADERAFLWWDITILQVHGSIEIQGSFAVILDKKVGKKSYWNDWRVFQIDQKLRHEETIELIKKELPEAVIYYHKIYQDERGDWHITQIGKKPYGFECVLEKITDSWVYVLTKNLKERIVIPKCKVYGLTVNNG